MNINNNSDQNQEEVLHHHVIDTKGENNMNQDYDETINRLWCCPMCSYRNDPIIGKCELCQYEKPVFADFVVKCCLLTL